METSFQTNLQLAIEIVKELITLDKPSIPPKIPNQRDEDRLITVKSKVNTYKDLVGELKEGSEEVKRIQKLWETELLKMSGERADNGWAFFEECKARLETKGTLTKSSPLIRAYKTKINELEVEIETVTVKLQREGAIGEPASASTSQTTAPNPVPTSIQNVKLPSPELKKLIGNNWTSWFDIFNVSVNQNPNLPAVQKMDHLMSLLE